MRALAWTASAVLGSAVAVRLAGMLGAADTWLTAPLLGAFPWVVALAVVTALLVLAVATRVHRLRPAAAVLLVVAATGVVVVAPRTIAQAQPSAGGAEVTLAVLNARIGGADADRIVELASSEEVDLLAIVESTVAFDEALRAAGLGDVLPVVEPGPAGAVHAVGGLVPQRPGFPAGDTPDVVWSIPDGGQLRVTTVHAAAPIGRRATERWRTGVARTPPPGDAPAVVLGDFNATLDHATLRAVLDTGWRDAGAEAGRGLAVTYDGLLDSSPALPMGIDHVLVSPRIAVRTVRTHDVPGTDHRLVLVEMQLPA